MAIGFALASARILEQVILQGAPGVEAGLAQLKDPNRSNPYPTEDQAVAAFDKAMAAKNQSHIDAVKNNGLACREYIHTFF